MRRLLLFALLTAAFCHATAFSDDPPRQLRIVATLFPQYDFAKTIGGGMVAVSMLMPPGADSHSYEPSPSDMARLADADLVLYTGDAMEPWIARIREAVGDHEQGGVRKFFDVSAGIRLIADDDSHDRAGQDHDDREGGGAHEDAAERGHFHALDPHFWLDPLLAQRMARNIAGALAKLTEGEKAFSIIDRNTNLLIEELRRLNHECEALAKRAKRRILVFGGRFAFAYFFQRYGLEQVGVYDGCGPGVEPSVRRIVEVVQYVKDHGVSVVYHEELTEPRIARMIAEETGATPTMVHSLHNPSKDEFAAGAVFTDLMRANILAFAKGME